MRKERLIVPVLAVLALAWARGPRPSPACCSSASWRGSSPSFARAAS